MLEASDSRGQVGQHSVQIIVEPAPALEEQAPAQTPQVSIAIALVLCVALLVVGAVLGTILIRRRHGPA